MENYCSPFFMFMGFVFTGILMFWIFLALPIWYIGKYNAEKQQFELLKFRKQLISGVAEASKRAIQKKRSQSPKSQKPI